MGDAKPAQINITVEFTGGLEMLFDNTQSHALSIPATDTQGLPFKVKDLIPWLCENIMKDSRRELFVLSGEGGIRPGILVLINDADWELEGEDGYEIREGDNILFVSTLHGG